MIFDDNHYDVIVIGGGAGGGTLAGALSRKGKNVLVLERGGAMALEDQNVADVDLFRKDRYHPKSERWFGPDGDPFAPQTSYARGGNTKIWGAVLERMREQDFSEVSLQQGMSPAWPFDYAHLAPYYDQAETLYRVHGQAHVDPTEPARSKDFDHAPRPVVPFLEQLREGLRGAARARVAVRPQERPGHGLEALALERRHGAARRPAPQGAGLDRARPLELRVAHGGLAVGRAAREQLRERDEGRAGPVGAALAEHPLGHHALQVAALLVARRVDADGDAVHVRAEPNVQIHEGLPPGDGRLQEGVRDGAGRRHHEEKEAPRLLHWRRSRAL